MSIISVAFNLIIGTIKPIIDSTRLTKLDTYVPVAPIVTIINPRLSIDCHVFAWLFCRARRRTGSRRTNASAADAARRVRSVVTIFCILKIVHDIIIDTTRLTKPDVCVKLAVPLLTINPRLSIDFHVFAWLFCRYKRITARRTLVRQRAGVKANIIADVLTAFLQPAVGRDDPKVFKIRIRDARASM